MKVISYGNQSILSDCIRNIASSFSTFDLLKSQIINTQKQKNETSRRTFIASRFVEKN
jgi:hypothetical protein